MKFEKAFKINNKELSKFNEGKCGEFIFTDEAGQEFKSFLSMVKKSGINDRHQIESLGTENYHKYSMLSTFVHTDGVAQFCKEYECYWLLDLIVSVFPYLSKWLIKFENDGHFKQVENLRGIDDFLTIYLRKTGENKAVLSVESVDFETGEDKTVYIQNIPYTNIKIDV